MIKPLEAGGPVGKRYAAGLRKSEKERPPRKTGVIHPSEISICRRMAQYSYMATKNSPPKKAPKLEDQKRFDLGHWIHECVQESIAKAWPDGTPEITIWDPETLFYGHCDFLVPNERVVEVKTMSQDVFRSLRTPYESHIRQVTIYAGVLGVETCNLFYINRNNGDYAEFEMEVDYVVWAEMCAEAAGVIEAAKEDRLLPGEYKYTICKTCGYRDACEYWEYKS